MSQAKIKPKGTDTAIVIAANGDHRRLHQPLGRARRIERARYAVAEVDGDVGVMHGEIREHGVECAKISMHVGDHRNAARRLQAAPGVPGVERKSNHHAEGGDEDDGLQQRGYGQTIQHDAPPGRSGHLEEEP